LVFQAKKWNWKRVAANLLLVPVLGGGTVAVVNAQLGKSGGGNVTLPTSQPAQTAAAEPMGPNRSAATGDPKQLLKDGRKALAEGRYAEAQDLAQKAEANNPSAKWGLFDDTPAALRKDIQAAVAKANKTQSEQLVKQARTLASRPGTDAERAYNLDNAIQMARKADQLHGPYSSWDTGDRADKLVKDLEASRSKLKVAAARPGSTPGAPGSGAPGTGTPGGSTGATAAAPAAPVPPVRTAAATTPAKPTTPAPVGDKKAAAVKLLNEGRALADQGNYAAAKAKFVEADRLGAAFDAREYSPGFALQELNTRGAAAMDKLIRDAQGFSAQKDFVRADAALTSAAQVAATLGLFPKPVAEAKAALFVSSSGKFGTPSSSGLAPAGGPEYIVQTAPNMAVAPGAPPGTQTVYNNKPGTPGGTVTGRQLLEQATYEFRRGEFETASRLAVQAHNLGAQEEAARLLNSIDAEKLAQKKRVAAASVANAKAAYDQKDYQRAFGVLVLIEPKLLPSDLQATRDQMLIACKVELDKHGTGVVAAAGSEKTDTVPGPMAPTPMAPTAIAPTPTDPLNPPGVARVGPETKTDGPAAQADTLRKLQAQKMRAESLRVQEESQKAFGRGETDLAMQMLLDHANRVRASGLDSGTIAQLLRPVEARLDTFRMMKGQADAIARQKRERDDARENIKGRGVAEEERKREVASLMRKYHDLVKKSDYAAAERVALQAKQLDPDDPAVGAMVEIAKTTARVKRAEHDKAEREKMFYGGLTDAEDQGPLVTTNDPVAVRLQALDRARGRGSLDNALIRTRTPAEHEIEMRLEKPISVEFIQTPLDQVIENLRTLTHLPLVIDARALSDERISEVQPITVKPGTAVAAKNVLAFALEQAGLSYVVEHDLVKVTTIKKSKGRMLTKVFSVADLVTPVPNFALPDYANFDKMLNRNALNSGKAVISGLTPGVGGPTPYVPRNGLNGGEAASTPLPGTLSNSLVPGIQQSPAGGSGGRLETTGPLGGSATISGANNSKHEQLIKLVTSMVRPHSWDGQGGPGKVEFFDIGSALVVNQTADVIQEIADLLDALRRLQDLAVAVEIRIVSLAESFFERMGVDFSVNIKTDTTKFEPALTSQSFRPQPFVNDINNKAVTIGLTPAGTFTPDLDVPIRATSFQRAIPGFGNYPNSPGNDGGISLGLAFLNDIQVYTFMEMAQGDQRSNIMQAPKLTLFNGQTATLTVNNTEFFVTDVQVVTVNGQIVFIPQNTPLPGPGNFNQGGALTISVQAVVSADRRFVRLNLPVNLAAQQGAAVPLFPITTFVTPVFEGGSQGQPIPFTQFLQQPSFISLNIQTTVVCPDGGTVLLGGLKTLLEGRNEFGPPFLSKIPYLNRLFKNVGVGRETRHVMIMVTPRIIINSEEEIFQTEGRPPQ
jgi:tetratricopeptide (TPR) repeat protein